jgi:hypothetical protein
MRVGRSRVKGEITELTVLEMAGERTRPRVPFPASRRKTLFGGTPNTTREDACTPQKNWTSRSLGAKSNRLYPRICEPSKRRQAQICTS